MEKTSIREQRRLAGMEPINPGFPDTLSEKKRSGRKKLRRKCEAVTGAVPVPQALSSVITWTKQARGAVKSAQDTLDSLTAELERQVRLARASYYGTHGEEDFAIEDLLDYLRNLSSSLPSARQALDRTAGDMNRVITAASSVVAQR